MTPDQQAIIIAQSAQGVTQRNIAAQIGTSHVSVDRWQDRLRPLIEEEINSLITEGLNASRKTIVRLAKQGADTEDKDWAKIGLDASKTILNASGITGQPSTIINALIQVNAAPEQAATVNLLAEFLQSRMQASKCAAIDVTPNSTTNSTTHAKCTSKCTSDAQSRTASTESTIDQCMSGDVQSGGIDVQEIDDESI